MANLLQSTQTQATSAPSFYTDYLSNLASQGQQATQNAQFVGAQPLQEQAFSSAPSAVTAYQPTLSQAGDVLTQAASSTSPLSAGLPYMATAATNNPALMAESYMSPYARMAAQQMSDIAQRNIRQNLAPGATAAAVGSGQFGSQRGAQVLGQVEAQANQDLNAQIANMLNTGYQQALTAAGNQQNLLAQLGSTAGQQAAQGQQNLTQAGGALSSLAGQNQALGLAGINALSTLGGQQQTIAQNAQNYPLTKLASLAALLQGQQIPSTVKTQLEMSPFSALGTLGAAGLGLISPKYDASGKPIASSTPLDYISKAFKDYFPSLPGTGLDSIPGGTTDTSGMSGSQTTDVDPYTGLPIESGQAPIDTNYTP